MMRKSVQSVHIQQILLVLVVIASGLLSLKSTPVVQAIQDGGNSTVETQNLFVEHDNLVLLENSTYEIIEFPENSFTTTVKACATNIHFCLFLIFGYFRFV